MEEQQCPRCKTTSYRNPALKLMVNVCGHSLCENCVELLFVRGSGTCPECGTPLRRSGFRIQQFEDATVEKEVDIRKKILKDYNKKETDFSTLRQYNDYLEEIEEIVFNLAYGIDVEATKRKIEQYKKDNQTVIRKNRSKLSEEDAYLEAMLEEENRQLLERRQQVFDAEIQEKIEKKKNKEALLDELMYSDLPAGHILASRTARTSVEPMEISKPRQTTSFSTGIKLGGSSHGFLSVSKEEEGEMFQYTEPVIDMCGPNHPNAKQIEDESFLAHLRTTEENEKAGGYTINLACLRAIQEAISGLYFIPAKDQPADSSLEDNYSEVDMEISSS